MKKFSFKLDSVLKYRQHQEEKARRDLTDATNAWVETREVCDGLVEKKEKLLDQLRIDAMEGMAASWYMACQNYVRQLDDELEQAHNRLENQNRIVEDHRESLKKQYMAKESLDSLKSIYAQNHKTLVEQEEQKLMDEMILMKRGGLY
ncbi:flagellar export protein FliJ [Desulfocicer niacini]